MKIVSGLVVVALSVLGMVNFGIFTSCHAQAASDPKEIGQTTSSTPKFVPPPRTVTDILQLLDAEKPKPEVMDARRKTADATPPEAADSKTLAKFYYDRGLRANGVGRASQWLEDARRAYQFASDVKKTDHVLYLDILWNLQRVESFNGNVQNAKRVLREAIQAVAEFRDNTIGNDFGHLSTLAGLEVASGSLEKGQQYLKQLEDLYRRSQQWGDWPKWGPGRTLSLAATYATIASYEGRYVDAEKARRQAILASEGDAKVIAQNRLTFALSTRDSLLQALAEDLLQQGRMVEAEIEARRALSNRLQAVGKASPTVATALTTLARTLIAQGRYKEAEQIAHHAIESLQLAGIDDKSRTFGRPSATLAAALIGQAKYSDALTVYDELGRALSDDESARRTFVTSNPDAGLAMLRSGRIADARAALDIVYQDARGRFGEKHLNTLEARGLRAVAMARSGDTNAAIRELHDTAGLLIEVSRQVEDSVTPEAIREARKRAILETYLEVLSASSAPLPDGTPTAEEAFHVADAIRGQTVQRAVAASSARAKVGDPVLADLIRREQDARSQIAALFGLLVNVQNLPADQRDPEALKQLPKDIDDLRTARAKLRDEIERRFPDYANLIDPKPATVAQVRSALRSGEALIATYVGDDRTFVWALSRTGPVAFSSVSMNAGDLGKIVADLRKALDPQAETLEDIPRFNVSEAYRLYHAILGPVEGAWKNANHLLIVPHGALAQLPLSVLPTAEIEQGALDQSIPFSGYKSVRWLVRQAAVTQLPSVSTLMSLRSLPAGNPTRRAFLGIGDPIFSKEQLAQVQVAEAGGISTRGRPLHRRSAPAAFSEASADLASLPRLPDTADEVKSIAVVLHADPSKDVLLGTQANETAVETGVLSNRRVIMFATHGLVPGDLNGLTQPALALTAPALADGNGDGLLTMEEILGLKLDADWVVLSACNTASGDGVGAEAVSGLGRAFFYAGARALLVSNWPVETTTARLLTTDLFRRQAENPVLGRAEALRQSMLALIDGPGGDGFSYAHPIFWAPFTVVGDGG